MRASVANRTFARAWLALGYAFLYVPIVALVVYSFNDSPVPNVWRGFTLRWYAALPEDRELIAGLALSLKVAIATACASVVLGTLAAFALVRYRRFFGSTLFSGMVAAPLVMPEVIIGLSLLLMLVSLQRLTEAAFGVGIPERGMLTIWFGHLLLGMAYATVVVRARLQTLNPQLEEAALDLGARPWQVFWLVTLPMIGQALLSAFLLTFTLSLDDVVLSAVPLRPWRDDDAAGHLLARPPRPEPERQRGGDDHHHVRRGRRRRRELSARAQRAPAHPRRRARRAASGMSEASAAQRALAYLALAASMAIVGGYVGFSKALVIVFPVFLLAGLRFAIAAVAMAPWLRRPATEAVLDARSRRLLFLESFFGNFLFSIFMLYGMRQSSALAAGVIMAAMPAVVGLLSWLLLGERIGARIAAAIACAIAGIGLVALARDAEGELASGSLAGSALLLAAVTCEALYVVIGKKLTASLGPKRISALINLWGLVLVAPLALWQLVDFSPRYIDWSYWALLFVYAIACERGHRVALDDRHAPRSRGIGRDLHGVPAGQRGRRRRRLLRRALHRDANRGVRAGARRGHAGDMAGAAARLSVACASRARRDTVAGASPFSAGSLHT
jgi:putrescine transport system permease protein